MTKKERCRWRAALATTGDGVKHAERDRDNPMLIEHRHRSARVRCSHHARILMLDYSGLIDPITMAFFDGLVLPDRRVCTSSLEHIDRAVTLFPYDVGRAYWPGWMPPSAVIVRPDQQSESMAYCANLAKFGILRQTFLQHQEELAQTWVRAAGWLTQSNSHRPT